MKKNNSLIIFLFFVLASFFGCMDSCDGVNIQDLPFANYVINYSQKVSDGQIDKAYKTYGLVKRGTVKVDNPFDNEFNAMNDIEERIKKFKEAAFISAANELTTTNSYFDLVQQKIGQLDDTVTKAQELFNDVNDLVDLKFTNTSSTYNLLNYDCSLLSDEVKKLSCQNIKDDLESLFTNLYAKSSFLVLQIINNNLDVKTNDLKNLVKKLQTDVTASGNPNLVEINTVINTINSVLIPLFDKSSDDLLKLTIVDLKASFTTLETEFIKLEALVNSTALYKNISDQLNDIDKYINDYESLQSDIKKAAAPGKKQNFINTALATYASVLVSKDIEINDPSDVDNIKNIFETAKQVLLVKADMDLQANDGLVMALATSIFYDPKSNIGNVYTLDIASMINNVKELGQTDTKEIQDYVVKSANQAVKELAAKSSNTIVFVIDVDKLASLPVIIDHSKLVEATKDDANVLVLGKPALMSNITTSALSYSLQGLSPTESFLVAQEKLNELNNTRLVKLSSRVIDMAADNIAKILFFDSRYPVVNIAKVNEASSNVFAKFSSKVALSDKEVQKLASEALGANYSMVNKSSILRDNLSNLTKNGVAHYQEKANDVDGNLNKIEQDVTSEALRSININRIRFNNSINNSSYIQKLKDETYKVIMKYASILTYAYQIIGFDKLNNQLIFGDTSNDETTDTIKNSFNRINKLINSGIIKNPTRAQEQFVSLRNQLDGAEICYGQRSLISGDADSERIINGLDPAGNIIRMLDEACAIIDNLNSL